MKVFLKVKIMSLAAEARLIRAEERNWPGEHDARKGLRKHRIRDVRREARHALIAYGFLRGRSYRQIERVAAQPPDWKRVEQLIEKFGQGDLAERRQRFATWKEATEA